MNRSKLNVAVFMTTIGATIAGPGALNNLYHNPYFRFAYFFYFIQAETRNLKESLVYTLIMLFVYDLLKTKNDGFFPFFKDFSKTLAFVDDNTKVWPWSN